MEKRFRSPGSALLAAVLLLAAGPARSTEFGASQTPPQETERSQGLLALLGLEVSPESLDYVANKTQFQLHTLLTEQRHPKTWNLDEQVGRDSAAGLRMLFAVDEDIKTSLGALAKEPAVLEQAAAAVADALSAGRKVYIYGCGATGRLAKQMESTFWRPFWRSVKAEDKVWAKLAGNVPRDIEERLIGEMTGADRALISSLEGFEDLQLIGRLQLADRGVRKGDVVICVTEGGETSSVIGTMLAALDQWKAEPRYDPLASRRSLYFVYNNPDERLQPFLRSRTVILEPGITKINLTTGPQAITGSTRMQATTSETYVVGTVLEAAAERLLRRALPAREMARLGFPAEFRMADRLREFGGLLDRIKEAVPDLAAFTDLESATYAAGRFSTYCAGKGLITVFIDSTERSPTFRLYPLDTVKEPSRKCWIQVWAPASGASEAWQAFLGRPFRGLDPALYRQPFETEIEDVYLRQAALTSLTRAGSDQAELYDFSFSMFNLKNRAPRRGDLGVLVALTPEEVELELEGSYFDRFLKIQASAGASLAVVLISDRSEDETSALAGRLERRFAAAGGKGAFRAVPLRIDSAGDPFALRQQVAAKMLLNAHSTAVMAKLGRVIGNTMTNVSPSNLKLIGRATYLIQSHVNDALSQPGWVAKYGRRTPVAYGEANAVLFDAIAFLKTRQRAGQTAEVALSIIRILESLRQKRGLTNEEASRLVRSPGLRDYLAGLK
ncbi:MAG: hypothetical protein OEW05_03020 [Candidatus Aminicenantes bacterium]|nr:hypothetical protein [Candidatus Aminicenantes bacterium]